MAAKTSATNTARLPKSYPSTMYHAVKAARTVANAEHALNAIKDGWRLPEEMKKADWHAAWCRAAGVEGEQADAAMEALGKGVTMNQEQVWA